MLCGSCTPIEPSGPLPLPAALRRSSSKGSEAHLQPLRRQCFKLVCECFTEWYWKWEWEYRWVEADVRHHCLDSSSSMRKWVRGVRGYKWGRRTTTCVANVVDGVCGCVSTIHGSVVTRKCTNLPRPFLGVHAPFVSFTPQSDALLRNTHLHLHRIHLLVVCSDYLIARTFAICAKLRTVLYSCSFILGSLSISLRWHCLFFCLSCRSRF